MNAVRMVSKIESFIIEADKVDLDESITSLDQQINNFLSKNNIQEFELKETAIPLSTCLILFKYTVVYKEELKQVGFREIDFHSELSEIGNSLLPKWQHRTLICFFGAF